MVFLVLLHFHQQITNLLKCPKTKPQKQYFYKMDLKSSVLFLLIQLSVSLSLHIITSFADIPLNSTLYALNFNQSWPLPNSTFSLSLTKQTPLSFIPAITHSGGAPVSTAGKTPVDSSGSFQFHPTGLIRLINGSGSVIWDTNTQRQCLFYLSSWLLATPYLTKTTAFLLGPRLITYWYHRSPAEFNFWQEFAIFGIILLLNSTQGIWVWSGMIVFLCY